MKILVRTIAVLGPKHFSITRKQDLERVLAMAQARELREATERAYKSGSVEDMAQLQILKDRMARR